MSRTQISNFLVDEVTEHVYIRETYGKTLVELGREYPNIVVLDADLTVSTKTNLFGKEFPNRFFTMGVSEQDMMATAAGFALSGKIPFASTFAIFATGRAWEHVRQSIVFPKLNVKIVATHAGVTVGEDGATHQALEDIALMRVLPNMVVIVPSDAVETEKAVLAAATNGAPTYVRFEREETAVYTTNDSPFEIGRAEILWEDRDPKVAIVACGPLVYQALRAAKKLHASKIASIVVNCHTLKPFDAQTIVHVAK